MKTTRTITTWMLLVFLGMNQFAIAQHSPAPRCAEVREGQSPPDFETAWACIGRIAIETREAAGRNRFWPQIEAFLRNPSGRRQESVPPDPETTPGNPLEPQRPRARDLLPISDQERIEIRLRVLGNYFYSGEPARGHRPLREALDAAEHNALLFALGARYLEQPSERAAIAQLFRAWEFYHANWISQQSVVLRGIHVPLSSAYRVLELLVLFGVFQNLETGARLGATWFRTARDPRLQELVADMTMQWRTAIETGGPIPGTVTERIPDGVQSLLRTPLPSSLQTFRSRVQVTFSETRPALESMTSPRRRLTTLAAAAAVTAAHESWERYRRVNRIAPGALFRSLQYTLMLRTQESLVNLRDRLRADLGSPLPEGRSIRTDRELPDPIRASADAAMRERIVQNLAVIRPLQQDFTDVNSWLYGPEAGHQEGFRTTWTLADGVRQEILQLQAFAESELALRIPAVPLH